MLKVLVIDDERLVRQMVIRCIDWEEIGLHIVGEASSARMGMEMIDELHPDLIFMDVRMPGMDGLTCSRQILKKNPQIKILILSGHDEFEYASEGIRIGVFDYILKPINAEELRKAALKAKATILEEQSHSKEFERFKEELEKHASYIMDRQLNALVRSRTPQQYLDSLAYFHIEMRNDIFQVALVEIVSREEGAYGEKAFLVKMYAREIIEDYYGDMQGMFVIDSGADWIILLNNESETAIYDHGENLKGYLENNTDAKICIGVGNIYTEIEHVCESYREAKDALKCHFLQGEAEVIYFRDICPYFETESTLGLNEDTIHELGTVIRMCDTQKAESILDGMLERFKRTGGGRDQILVLAMEILAELMKLLSGLKIDIQAEQFNYSEMIEGLFSLGSFPEIREYLKGLVQDVCRTIGLEVSDKEKSLVRKVKDYITENYAQEDISLNFLAQLYYVNSSYLSRVFKEKTGNTFTGYLFEVRMKAAESLALTTELKGYEIAEKVGISDPHYFSSCFKKYTGLSVSDFKKQGKI